MTNEMRVASYALAILIGGFFGYIGHGDGYRSLNTPDPRTLGYFVRNDCNQNVVVTFNAHGGAHYSDPSDCLGFVSRVSPNGQ